MNEPKPPECQIIQNYFRVRRLCLDEVFTSDRDFIVVEPMPYPVHLVFFQPCLNSECSEDDVQ